MKEFDNDDNEDNILTNEEQNKINLLQNKSSSNKIILRFSTINDEIKTTIKYIKDCKIDVQESEKKLKDADNIMKEAVSEIYKIDDEINKIKYSSSSSSEDTDYKIMRKSNYEMDIEKYMQIKAEAENKIREAKMNLLIARQIVNTSKSRYEATFSIARRLGISPFVTINNISGKNAWIILSPGPIQVVSSIAIEKLGQMDFSVIGEHKCQQSMILNNTSSDFELDNSQIYYTVFFDHDNKWKIPFKDKKINTRKYNINLLEKHVAMAYHSDSLPVS